MAWFTKKQETSKLQRLPELPNLPDLPEHNSVENLTPPINQYPEMPMEEIHSLPSFPNSETANKMSREAIKSALEIQPKSKPYTREIDSTKQLFSVEDSENEEDEELGSISPKKQMSSDPIFVRIDKFQIAVKNINEIRKQVAEIEAYLAEIKKIKAKEEEELQEWEHEIIEAKNKLDNIDKILFSKL